MSSNSALRHVFVGGYTPPIGNAVGVTSLLNERSAKRVRLESVSTMPLTSPTWLTRHPTLPVLLATGESSPGTLSSLRWDADGSLSLLSTVETAGDGACHVAVTADGQYAVVASYRSGLLSVIPIDGSGILSDVVDSLEFDGSGPVTDRQEASHAHQVVVVGDELLSCDLGGDQIYRLHIDDEGVLTPAGDPIRLPAGSGPRHLAVVEDHLVVTCELSGQLWLGARDGDGWSQAQIIATSTRDGLVQPSGIAAAGTRVYVASRGVDTIAVFDLDPAVSELTPVGEFDTGGAWPRDVTVDGGLLWVSNERSDTVTLFEVSPVPPAGPAAELALPTPTCVVLVHDEEDDSAPSDDAARPSV